MADEELTTIQVTKRQAAQIKQLFPELKNDALRVDALLGNLKVIKTETVLPADADPDAQPVTFVTVQSSK